MTHARFLLQTLRFHWRANLAVVLGVATATAVVAGALVVGDSVRGSLRDLTLVRLGRIDHALQSPRFFREDLAGELAARPGFADHFSATAPAIVLPASLERRLPTADAPVVTRAGRVNLYALDDRLWQLLQHGDCAAPVGNQVLLSQRLAAQLECAPGDDVLLIVELPSAIPRDSLLGERDETSRQLPLKVKAVLPESSGAGRLGLQPDQQLPQNAMVSLSTLQAALGIEARRPTRRQPTAGSARVNALFVANRDPAADLDLAAARTDAEHLTAELQQTWRPADFNTRVVADPQRAYVSIESERMILDPLIVAAAERVAAAWGVAASPVSAYLANELFRVTDASSYSMYSIVAGVAPEIFARAAPLPFGRFDFVGEPPAAPLGEGGLAAGGPGEIILNAWLAEDLHASTGDLVGMKFHLVGSHGELPEEQRQFRVVGVVTMNAAAADRGLTPEVPGITDVDSLADWDQPFPMKMTRITNRDEMYWTRYKATPKAFVSLKSAELLWNSHYGQMTSLRVARPPAEHAPAAAGRFASDLARALNPADLGLAFRPVRAQGLAASAGTTDFGGLFIGFSLFLVLSATILIGLLFRLGLERRVGDVGLLLAVGFSFPRVRRLLLAEAWLIVLTGAALGAAAAVGYAWLMIYGLKTWWIGAIGTRFLDLHVQAGSLLVGCLIAIGVGIGAIAYGLRGLGRLPVRGLLLGLSQPPQTPGQQQRRGRRAGRVAQIAALAAVALTVAGMSGRLGSQEAFAGFSWRIISFFVMGIAALVAGLAAFAAWIDSDRAPAVRGRGAGGLLRLGIRNSARHRARSVLTVGLIAAATFLIVAIAAGHRNPAVEEPRRDSGNGGFTLVGELSAPVLADLNTAAGREKLDLVDPHSATVLQPVTQIVSFTVNPGENASCLNIYQTSQPTILGVPREMIARGGFKFADTPGVNPWVTLEQGAEGEPIPVLGDMNTLQYSLHVGLGAVLEIRDEQNQPVKVRVAGMLDGSVFQGVLLMDARRFEQLFPSRVGSRYFLVDVPSARAREVADLLESKLPGFDAEPVAARLADFLAVQNTYLSTFQALGGLGLLLGTIGLATVMLRNVLERRGELALLRAIGFRNSGLAWLVLAENSFLLGCGLAVGSAAALLAMLPQLLSTGADCPWKSVAAILGTVFVVGASAALLAVATAIRTPLLATLRAES